MSALPRVSGREVVKALRKIGYAEDRQRGSHNVLRQTASPHRRVTLPGFGGFYLDRRREGWAFKFNPGQKLRALFG